MTNSNEIFELLSEIRTTQIEQARQLGRIDGQLEALGGPQGRINSLEATNNRQWWLHAAVLPIMFSIHGFAHKIGLNL